MTLALPALPSAPRLEAAKLTLLAELREGLDPPSLLWLSGYFAGLAEAPALPLVSPTPAAASALVLYGSQTGNAERAARELQQTLVAAGLAARLQRAGEVTLKSLRDERLLYLVISTQGDGDPPEDARALYEALLSRRAPPLPELGYAVLGLGDRTYPKFCAVAQRLDARLAELGARRLIDPALADVDIEATAAPFRQRALATTRQLLAAATRVELREPADARAAAPVEAPLELLDQVRLTLPESGKDVRHLELACPPGWRYEPGDALAVRPVNPPPLVEALLARLSLDGDTPVEADGQTQPLRAWLAGRRELTRPNLALLKALAERGRPEPLALPAEARSRLLRSATVEKLLAAHPVALSASELVALLPPLATRAYSIASSQAAVGDEIHLTVAVREQGAASGYLAALAPGSPVTARLEPNPAFRLPADDVDLVMIGPGTGVAPFRAFLQQRVARGARGRNWLFFGERHFRSSFLYQLEWQQALKRGQLHRLDLAFSRDRARPEYVQHRIAERAHELVDWLERGAGVYLCGDAERMAPDVLAALRGAYATVLGLDDEAAAEKLSDLVQAGRLKRDVY